MECEPGASRKPKPAEAPRRRFGNGDEDVPQPLGPQAALDAYELYGAWRSATEPGYAAGPVGLRAVIDRGRHGNSPPRASCGG